MARQADEIVLKIVAVCKECPAGPEAAGQGPATGAEALGERPLVAMEPGPDDVPYYLCASCWLMGYIEARSREERARAVGIVVP